MEFKTKIYNYLFFKNRIGFEEPCFASPNTKVENMNLYCITWTFLQD